MKKYLAPEIELELISPIDIINSSAEEPADTTPETVDPTLDTAESGYGTVIDYNS